MKSRNKNTRQLLGVDTITDYSITTRQGDLVFFVVAPTNISVLPEDSITARINALMNIIRGIPGIELMATDSMQSFEHNKQFYKEQLELETLPELRRLLTLDMEHLDSIQLMTASSREFYMILRLRNEIKGDVYSYLGNLEKFIHEHGFTVHRASEQELKKLLAVYYEQSISPDCYPNYDGQQYVDDGGDLEKEE